MNEPVKKPISCFGLYKTVTPFIAIPENIDDLKQHLNFAKKNKLKIAIKSGGNSYSDVFLNEQLIIDISKLNSVKSFDSENGVIVVEAIKLLESRLSDHCDSVWVVNASLQKRLERLVRRDNINTEDAQNRLLMQGSQQLKLKRADVIIENEGSIDETSVQVRYEWGKIEMPK